jgi:hypothetical protein
MKKKPTTPSQALDQMAQSGQIPAPDGAKPAAQDPAPSTLAAVVAGSTHFFFPDVPAGPPTVKVRFKHVPAALAYSRGEVADLPQALYDQYIGEGEYFEKI